MVYDVFIIISVVLYAALRQGWSTVSFRPSGCYPLYWTADTTTWAIGLLAARTGQHANHRPELFQAQV